MCKLRIEGQFYNMTAVSVYAATGEEKKRNAEDVERFYNMTVVSVYAATGEEKKRNAEDVERFYNKLSDVCDKTLTNDALILPGDFNTQIWKEHSNKRVAGRHTLHDITSWNREKLVHLAIAHNVEISSTKFQHKRIHKGTWKVPRQNSCNQTSCTHK